MKKFLRNKYIVASFLCLNIYIIYLIMMQIYPFGDYSILKCDLYQQYINFFCYLREVLLHGKSIAICWNLGLVNNFYTTFAYYLISPLNLFVVFFNSSNMDIFVEIITYAKITLMANFFILFLEKSYKYKSNETIIFGLIYAFSSYVICYSFHIMWLDCVYMLPIVLLFVDKYIDNGKIYPLVLSLSYSILTNYYIGYIVAFFSGIYFLAKLVINKKSFKLLFKFLFAIGISFGIGMIVIFPSIMQLKGKMDVEFELIKIDVEKIRLFINVIFNNYVYMFTQKSCFAFSSTMIIMLLPMYYFNKNIPSREKIGFTFIIFFLLLPIFSPFLNKIWHAFTTPNCFNYRYSFTLIFILILIGAREFQNKEYCKKWHFLLSFMIFIVLNLIEIIFLKKGFLNSDNYTVNINSIALSFIIYILIMCITYIYFYNNSLKNASLLLLLIVIVFDLLVGARSGQNNNDKYFKRDIIKQYDNFMQYFISKLENPETERIFFEPDEYGSNMSLKYGYSNIGFFTSARSRDTLKSMYKMGYNVQMDEQLWVTSYSGTFLNYCLAGVKYYITKRPIENNEIYGFEFEEKYDNLYVYKNKNAFNIGYYLARNIDESYNPFKMQNEYIEELLNKNTETTDYKTQEKYFQNIENSKVLECKKDLIYNENTGENIIKYKIKAKKECNVYLASDYDLQVYINNKPIFKNYSNIWSYETGIKQIKHLKENEELEFTVVTKHNLDLLYIYVSNNEEIQRVIDNKNENFFEIKEINKNGLKGIANFKDDGYLALGISYDNCWKIYVDGKESKKEAIAGSFLGVKLGKGIHRIEIKANIFK